MFADGLTEEEILGLLLSLKLSQSDFNFLTGGHYSMNARFSPQDILKVVQQAFLKSSEGDPSALLPFCDLKRNCRFEIRSLFVNGGVCQRYKTVYKSSIVEEINIFKLPSSRPALSTTKLILCLFRTPANIFFQLQNIFTCLNFKYKYRLLEIIINWLLFKFMELTKLTIVHLCILNKV